MLRYTVFRNSAAYAASAKLLLTSSRGFHSAATLYKAQAFTMPAMSPTMEKGGVVEWKYKVGEPFSAGDVLLEVETDKAQIDVEAQDDGKLAAIIIDNGTKDIKVGETIAYLAEVDDDLATLEIPKQEPAAPKPTPKKQETAPTPAATPEPKKDNTPTSEPKKDTPSGILSTANPSQTLFPSVQSLLHENGISVEDALNNIKASGPNGRILKGDVLAYLGKISNDCVVKVTEYIKSGESLDLTNIELKKPELKLELETSKTLLKPEPVVFTETLTLRVPSAVSSDQLSKSLRSYINEANYLSHEQPVNASTSDYYDPIFEELITPEPRQPRFSVSYQLTPLVPVLSPKQHDDIFDLLSGTSAATSSPQVEQPSKTTEYSLDVSVQVDGKFDDATLKAQRFIEYLKDLELVSEN